MSRSQDDKYLDSFKKRYAKASKKERGQILDEYVQTTGYHRKHGTTIFWRGIILGRGGWGLLRLPAPDEGALSANLYRELALALVFGGPPSPLSHRPSH